MNPSPFDHRPDPELGAWLKEALEAPGEGAFVERVLAQLAGAPGSRSPAWWQVLDSWARPGVAVALLVLAAATLWLAAGSPLRQGEVTLEEVLRAAAGSAAPAVLVAANEPPSFERVLGTVLEP